MVEHLFERDHYMLNCHYDFYEGYGYVFTLSLESGVKVFL